MAANTCNSQGHRHRDLRRHLLATETTCGICAQHFNVTHPHEQPDTPEGRESISVSLGGNPLARDNA